MNSVLNFINTTAQNLDSLQAKEFSSYIIGLSKWNLQEKIVGIIYHASFKAEKFHHRQKVVKIIDSLLKVDSYRFIIWNVVFDIFVRFFITAFRQNNFLEVQALKLIRISWTKHLPANFPQEMKKAIYKQTGINIEVKEAQQSQNRKYYRVDPRMKNKVKVQENRNYDEDSKLKKQQEERTVDAKQQTLTVKIEALEQTTYQKKTENLENQGTVLSDTTDSLNDEQIDGTDSRKRHLKISDEHKAQEIIRKLIKCCYIECKQCGQQFMSQQKYTIHLKQHFQSNLKDYNESRLRAKNYHKKYVTKLSTSLQKEARISVKNNRPLLSSEAEWINDSSQQQKSQEQQTKKHEGSGVQKEALLKVNEKQLEYFKKDCPLCGNQLDLKTCQNDWTVENGIKIEIHGKHSFMHSYCHKQLKSQNKE